MTGGFSQQSSHDVIVMEKTFVSSASTSLWKFNQLIEYGDLLHWKFTTHASNLTEIWRHTIICILCKNTLTVANAMTKNCQNVNIALTILPEWLQHIWEKWVHVWTDAHYDEYYWTLSHLEPTMEIFQIQPWFIYFMHFYARPQHCTGCGFIHKNFSQNIFL